MRNNIADFFRRSDIYIYAVCMCLHKFKNRYLKMINYVLEPVLAVKEVQAVKTVL